MLDGGEDIAHWGQLAQGMSFSGEMEEATHVKKGMAANFSMELPLQLLDPLRGEAGERSIEALQVDLQCFAQAEGAKIDAS